MYGQYCNLYGLGSSFGQSEMAGRALACCGCGKAMATAGKLEAHLAAVHLDWKPFECRHCEMVWLPTEQTLRDHCAALHPTLPYFVSFQPDEKKQAALSALVQQSVAMRPGQQIQQPRTVSGLEVPVVVNFDRSSDSRLTTSRASVLADVTARDGTAAAPTPTDFLNAFFSPKHRHVSPASPVVATAEKTSSLAQKVKAECSDDIPATQSSEQQSESGKTTKRVRVATPIDDEAIVVSDDDEPMAREEEDAAATSCLLCSEVVGAKDRKKHIFRRHVEKKFIRCPLCSHARKWYRAQVQKHMDAQHKRAAKKAPLAPVDERESDEALREYAEQHVRCFGQPLPTAAPTKTKPAEVLEMAARDDAPKDCRLCFKTVGAEERWLHVWRNHAAADPDDPAQFREYEQITQRLFQSCFGDAPTRLADVKQESGPVLIPRSPETTPAPPSRKRTRTSKAAAASPPSAFEESRSQSPPTSRARKAVCFSCAKCEAVVPGQHVDRHTYLHLFKQEGKGRYACAHPGCEHEAHQKSAMVKHVDKHSLADGQSREQAQTTWLRDLTDELWLEFAAMKCDCFVHGVISAAHLPGVAVGEHVDVADTSKHSGHSTDNQLSH